MRKDEKLRTIYETIAPYITRTGNNWRDYLTFGARFFKHSFDNMLLIYAQNPDVTMLATTKQWNQVGRYVNSGAKGIAVCEYENARLTIKYLFDVSQTNGKEVKATDWQLAQNTKSEISKRLAFSHGFESDGFHDLLHRLAAEAVSDHYEAYLQGLSADIDGHLFSELPKDGFEAQFVDLLTDSVTYFMGKRCGLSDEEIPLENGMETVHHFNTLPLVGRLGNAVTSIAKNALLEMERTIKIVNKERTENHGKAIGGTELHREGRHDAAEHPSIQQSEGRPATGAIRQDGAGISHGEPSAAIYDFENGWHFDGENAPSQRGSSETDRGSHTANASKGADAGYRGHAGEDETSQQPAAISGGNRPPRIGIETEVNPSPTEQNTKKESSQDGSFFAPFSLTDEQVRRNCESILTSTELYPPELYRTVRSLYEQDGLSPEQKATSLGKIYSTYGDREYQDDVLYRTQLLGDDGISFYFGDGYTFLTWREAADVVRDLIDRGDYPVVSEAEFDRIGDFNIPDEVEDMGVPDYRKAQEDLQLSAVLDTVDALEQADKDANEEKQPASLPDAEDLFREYSPLFVSRVLCDEAYLKAREGFADEEKAKLECSASVERILASLPLQENAGIHEKYESDDAFRKSLTSYVFQKTYTDFVKINRRIEQMGQPKADRTDSAAHRNYRTFSRLFPKIVSGKYRYLRLESQGFEPLSVEWVGEDQVSVMHTFTQNGDLMRDPEMVLALDSEKGTAQAISYELSSLGIYQEVSTEKGGNAKLQKDLNSFLSDWLRNIEHQGYEPVRAMVLQNGEEIELNFSQPEAVEQNEKKLPATHADQLSLFGAAQKSDEDKRLEYLLGEWGVHVVGGKRRIYDFVQSNPTGSALASFLKKEYGISGGSVDRYGINYVSFDSKGVSYDWADENGKTQKTNVAWAKAAGVVGRLIQEGCYLDEPIAEEEPDFLSQIEILDESVDAHDGQIDMRLQAVVDDLTVGMISYSIYQDVPNLNMIEVLENYRRQGIGTKMICYLQEQFPDTEIEWGMMTEDGAAFHDVVTYSVENEDYMSRLERISEINLILEQNEKDWNAGVIFSVERDEEWNDLQDEKDDLEKELSELKPQRTFVRSDEGRTEEVPTAVPFAPQELTVPLPAPQKQEELSASEKENEIPPLAASVLTAESFEPTREPEASPPVSANFRYSEDYNLYPGGVKIKYKNNVEAIKLLKRIEGEHRSATAEEQIVLARYVGWGGLANAFSDKAAGWDKEYQELKSLLDADEYRDAMNSTITAYYTDPELIRYIYKALERFGFEGGPDRKLLDPAMGTGNFYSVLPEALARTKLYGVELDSITGRIAKQLYPNADISVMGYEATRFADNSFDGIIGNIPFNSVKIFDGRYDKLDFMIHDYFIAKSLDLLKPGGIIAFITSKGTLDKTDETVRKYIAQRAEFIGAIRLPNTAFQAIAGTEVTADILFLKKREHPIELSNDNLPEWVQTEIDREKQISYNRYFITHPEMALGEIQPSRNMYGREDGTACIAPEGQDLYAKLNRAIGDLHAEFSAEADQPVEEMEGSDETDEYADAPEGTKNCTYVVQDSKIFYCENKKLIPQDYTGKKAERIKGLCEIRTALLKVIAVQSREYEYRELEQAQAKLNEVYDHFVRRNGAINSTGNILAFSDDDQFPLLRSIEDERKRESGTVSWNKSAVFYKATIKSHRRPDHADTAEEALQISLNEKMKVDLPYMARLTGREPDQLIRELGDRIYLNPQKYYGNALEGWELAEEYLSGHVRDKLLYAKQKAEEYPDLFSRNVQALEAAQPAWLEPGDIHVQIGAPWIPAEYYRRFMYETFDTPVYLQVNDSSNNNSRIDVDYLEFTTTWRVSNKSSERESVKVNQTYGTKRVNAYEIFEDTLNLQSVTVRDPVRYVDKNGKDQIKYVVNADETMIARAKQNQIKEEFTSWVWRESERRDVLLKIYNERFNTVKPREYDGSHLVFRGMSSEEKLRPHQLNFAARVIYSGTGLAAHEVGAGKTAALIAAGMYMKQNGTVKKPIYVVPNPLTSQWATEFYRFFPNANILVTTIKDFEKQNRKKFVSKIAMNDYDAIIIGHTQFERIPISQRRQEEQLTKQINQISYAIEQMKQEKGENWAVKQMVIFRKNLSARLERLAAEFKKDDLLTFEQLGVDFLFVDEAHYFKNCFTYTKMRNVAGIGKSSSQRASDMLMKCQYLQEINNGRGVVFATGTPISNSMSELYVMQRFLQPQELERMGLSYFDNWAANFGEVVSSLEITPEGNGYRMRQRFSKFHNLPELMAVFKLVADIQTADMLNLPTPELEGGKPTVVAVEATPYQKAVMESYVERAEKIRSRAVPPDVDNMLKLTGEARLMAIDPRLVYEDAPNDPNTKLNRCIEDAFDIWEKTKEKRLTQLVFCDAGTPKPGRFNVYDECKRVLLEKGVPESEVAFVHDATTEAQRDALFEKVRQGEIRILLGSTSKLGTGVNVQKKLICTHDLDCPWKPSDLTQRAGRILRQFNDNPVVSIRRYVTKGTFDSYLWQIQEQKLRYITQVMSGKSIARSCEDIDETVLTAAEVKAIATDNPMLAEKMEVDNEVARLKLLRGSWQNERAVLERNINQYYPESITHHQDNIKRISADVELLQQTEDRDFQITVDGKTFNERVPAGELLMMLSRLDDWKGTDTPLSVGEYRGLALSLEHGSFESLQFTLKGSHTYRGDLGLSELGAITRIENAAGQIAKLLSDEKDELANFERQLMEAKKEIIKPFEYEQRLSEYAARQSEINTSLEFQELQKQEDIVLDEDNETEENEDVKEESVCVGMEVE